MPGPSIEPLLHSCAKEFLKVDSLNEHNMASIGVDPQVAETPCDHHRCDSCVVCRRGACCPRCHGGARDRADWRLPELGTWPGAVFGQLGVLVRDARGAECHICGRVFRMPQRTCGVRTALVEAAHAVARTKDTYLNIQFHHVAAR